MFRADVLSRLHQKIGDKLLVRVTPVANRTDYYQIEAKNASTGKMATVYVHTAQHSANSCAAVDACAENLLNTLA